MKSLSKLTLCLDIMTFLSYFLSFLSIPLCSFSSSFYLITWALTIIFVLTSLISLLFIYGLKIDLVFLSFLAFGVSALFSSLLNKMIGFTFSPILLSVLASFIYVYLKNNQKMKHYYLLSAYFSIIIFVIVFLISYRDQFFTFNFYRLGALFGDQNDIALFFALGYIFSFYFVFYGKQIFTKIFNILLLFLFVICGLATGSKIFVFSSVIVSVVMIFIFFGKKKWWLSLLCVVSFVGVFILCLNIPAFKIIKERILEFFDVFSTKKIEGATSTDYSTLFRIDMFLGGMELFARKPLFGWGTWGYATFGGINQGWSHNNFSETLANFGVIGTILFHYCFFVSFKSYSKNKKNNLLPFLCLLMFVISMVSIALNTQKIYIYLMPVLTACISDEKSLFEIKTVQHWNFRKNKRKLNYENC